MSKQIETRHEELVVMGTGVLLSGHGFYVIPSSSEPGRSHIVEQLPSRLSCDCKSFHYRGRCEHVRVVIAHKERLQLQLADETTDQADQATPASRETRATSDTSHVPPARAPSGAARATDHAVGERASDTALLRHNNRPFSIWK